MQHIRKEQKHITMTHVEMDDDSPPRVDTSEKISFVYSSDSDSESIGSEPEAVLFSASLDPHPATQITDLRHVSKLFGHTKIILFLPMW